MVLCCMYGEGFILSWLLLLLSITLLNFVKSTKRIFCLTLSYPTGFDHLKAKNKRMRASCVVLVLAVLLSSTLAKPTAYVDRDGQSDYLQYLLRQHGNGKEVVLSQS